MKKYELVTLQLVSSNNNCYLLIDSATREAAIIDPGCDAAKILAAVEENNADVKYIINTHGHWDHVGANRPLKEATGVDVLIHEADEPLLSRPELNLAFLFRGDGNAGTAERLLKDNDKIFLGELQLTVLHTPGHTEGGICLLCEDLLFTGDTLFRLSVGRSDFPGGDHDVLISSLARLLPLPDDLLVLPGHNSASTLGFEKANNPYFPKG